MQTSVSYKYTYKAYLYHQQVSGPALQAISDSKHRRSLCVFDHHNVFSAQTARANKKHDNCMRIVTHNQIMNYSLLH